MGQHIDVSLLDVQVAMLANQASNYLIGNQVPGRLGSAHPSIVPYQPFACADGHVMLAIGNDTQFVNLCLAAGCPELASDPLFVTNAQRVLNRDALIPVLQEHMAHKTIDEWCDLANKHGFPCGPINTVDRVFEDEQVKARQIRVEIDSARYGKVGTVASPMRLSESPVQYNAPPPELGQHTEDVLSELGLDAAKIAELRELKAI